MVKSILVVGGAGYIGSHVVNKLSEMELNIIIYDKKETKSLQHSKKFAKFIQGCLSDKDKLDEVFKQYKIDAVIHLANYIEVGESVKDPKKYFSNNITNGLILLDIMRKNSVNLIVFSSSAAVYGEPEVVPIVEDSKKIPTNPYGHTKLMFEEILKSYNKAYGMKFVALRYFNAAGADYGGQIGEEHLPETHLIPLILQTALGKRKEIYLFGTDYDTPDGTCIRDYVHVNDIANAHILALKALENGDFSASYNLGGGEGYSVKEIIKTVEEVTGIKVNVVNKARRLGDPARLIADYSKIKNELSWSPKFNLNEIIKTAWNWHLKIEKVERE